MTLSWSFLISQTDMCYDRATDAQRGSSGSWDGTDWLAIPIPGLILYETRRDDELRYRRTYERRMAEQQRTDVHRRRSVALATVVSLRHCCCRKHCRPTTRRLEREREREREAATGRCTAQPQDDQSLRLARPQSQSQPPK